MKSREELAIIYKRGISQTYWKSIMPNKLNELRTVIDLPPKATALKRGEYDAEVVKKLSETDFSTLGITNNIAKKCVLTFATSFFTPVGNEEIDLTGAGDHHSESE